jgi:ClpP class serine protease
MGSWILLAIVIAVVLLWGVPQYLRWRRDKRRRRLIRQIEQQRESRLITLIHRQEGLGFLLPFGRYIDIDDSEQLLRAIRLTPDAMPIDLVLHTPGGLVLASDQIAYGLKRHAGKVTVIVPHYAMSGGTLVALAADEILMDHDAVLGPVDPQLGSLPRGSWPAASILKALEQDNPNRDDETLILGDVARKAIDQVRATVRELLDGRVPDEEADQLAAMLSEGRWTHDYPIRLEEARVLGLPVSGEVPEAVYELMSLYPRRSQRRPSVEFIPTPYRTTSRGGRTRD